MAALGHAGGLEIEYALYRVSACRSSIRRRLWLADRYDDTTRFRLARRVADSIS